jgi:hypothetical protein
MYSPYTVMLGKKDFYSSADLDEPAVYPTMDSCLLERDLQTALYEQNTELKAVTITCEPKSTYMAFAEYFLKIEGFATIQEYGRSIAKKYLYTFAPFKFYKLNPELQLEVQHFLAEYGAMIIKHVPGVYLYYREGAAPVNSETLGYFNKEGECQIQLASAQELYKKAGSKKVLSFCGEGGHLQVLHEGQFHLSKMYNSNSNQYGTLTECITDKDFVLSDERMNGALGAVCEPSMSDSDFYQMTIYRQGY